MNVVPWWRGGEYTRLWVVTTAGACAPPGPAVVTTLAGDPAGAGETHGHHAAQRQATASRATHERCYPALSTTRTIRSARPAVDPMSSALRWSVPNAHALASSGLLPKA